VGREHAVESPFFHGVEPERLAARGSQTSTRVTPDPAVAANSHVVEFLREALPGGNATRQATLNAGQNLVSRYPAPTRTIQTIAVSPAPRQAIILRSTP